MKKSLLSGIIILSTTALLAEPDLAAMQRARAELDQFNARENQRIDREQEEAMIPVRARARDLRAKADRELEAASRALAPALAAGKADVDTAAFEQAKFAVLEVDNVENNRLLPEAGDKFEQQRQALARQVSIRAAKIDAMLFDGVEGGEKARDQMIRKAEIMAEWAEKLDALGLEQARAEREVNVAHTTKINQAEARLAALAFRASAAMNARVQQKLKKGEQPTPQDYTPQPDPAMAAVEAERDEARNALQTALEKTQASFQPRRDEIENKRNEALVQLGG